MRGCGWTRCMAHAGRTWTRSSPSGTAPCESQLWRCLRFSSSTMAWWDIAGPAGGSTVDTWSASAPGCLWMVFFHIFYVMVFSDPEVASTHCCCFSCFPASATLGNWTLRLRAPCIWQFPVHCLGVLFMAQCLVQQWVRVTR